MKSKILLVGAAAMALCACESAKNVDCEVATWSGFAQSAVSFTFDDGCANQFTLAQPMFDQRNFKATFYPVLLWTGGNYSALRAAQAAGHEIGCHTVHHPNLGEWTNEQVEAEYAETDQTILDSLGVRAITTAYPFCVRPEGDATANHYIAARNCTGKIEPATPADMLNISSLLMGTMSEDNRTYADLLRQFSATQEKGGWATLLFHEIDNGPGYSPFPAADLDSALMYLDENREKFWVGTFADVARYIAERDASVVTAKATQNEVVVSVTNTLDKEIYTQPLTIAFDLPEGWYDVEATQNGELFCACIVSDRVLMDVVPNSGDIIVKKKQ